MIETPTSAAQAVEADGAATRGAHAPGYPSERWERVVLMPGLELAVRDEPVLLKIAALIFEQYALSGAR